MELVKIKMGTSLFFYIYILLCIGLFLGLYFGLRKKSQKVQYWVLFGFLAVNFVLHFLKLALPYYSSKGFPAIIRKSTFENICAVSTMIFPFIFINKKSKVMKDYMFYLGTVSGIAGCVAPLPAMNLPFYHPETIRYYICHAGIWIVPVLMVVFGLHKLDYRRIWKSVFVYFGILGLIMVNEIILIRLGWVETSSFEEFFDPGNRDMGYAIGLPITSDSIVAKLILWLTPKAWKYPYVPILWEFFPMLILGQLLALLMSMYWEHEHFKTDCIKLYKKTVQLCKQLKEKIDAWKSKSAQGETPEAEDATTEDKTEEVKPENDTDGETETESVKDESK